MLNKNIKDKDIKKSVRKRYIFKLEVTVPTPRELNTFYYLQSLFARFFILFYFFLAR